MKTKYISYVSFLLICLFTACNDSYMEKYPLDEINDQNFWRTAEDLKTYANQLYPYISGLSGYSDDDKSDNQAHRDKHSYIWGETVVPVSDDGWGKNNWYVIRVCNYFLQRYHRAEGIQSEINVYLGEVLTFKALEYFYKVTRYGDVPWLTADLTTTSEELYSPRDSRILVVDSINSCLDRAIEYLPATSSENRLTKYAVLAFKSRINLYEGTFRKYHGLGDYERILRQAADAAKEIMDSGLFELYSTGNPAEDYHAFFQLQDMAGVKEAIFYIEYVADKRQHNRVRSVRESGSGMTKDFAESFLCRTDGLPISLSPDYKGDADFTDEFENRDYRMIQNIYTPDRPIFITEDGELEYENAPIYSTHVSTGYRMYKMYSPLAMDNEFEKCVIDDCPYRYGEVLINYAEAMAELGECTQAVLDISVNKLRDRVGMPHMQADIPFVDPAWPDWEVPVSPLINEIRRERRVEMAGEGLRWFDICRWKAGKLLEKEKTYLGARDPETGEYRILYPGYTRVWNDKLYLYPLPTDELNYNPNLTQNPGW